jgi:hypothetical protein
MGTTTLLSGLDSKAGRDSGERECFGYLLMEEGMDAVRESKRYE